MNSALKKIVVAAVDNQWLKISKYPITGYNNKTFTDLMDCIYIHYGQITPRKLMKNQEMMQASYHKEGIIEIIFDHIKTIQEFAIAGYFTFAEP